jgi:hypothetical protein
VMLASTQWGGAIQPDPSPAIDASCMDSSQRKAEKPTNANET